MNNYGRLLKISDQTEVNALLDKGWELLALEKNGAIVSDYGVSTVKDQSVYVLGISYKVLAENYKKIIDQYEVHGLKEMLYNKFEKDFDDSLDKYQSSSYWDTDSVENEFTERINHYEYWTSDLNKLKKMYSKETNANIDSFRVENFPF